MTPRFVCMIFSALVFNFSISQRNIDVLHYKIQIELSDKTDTIKGQATITLNFTEPSDKFSLNLAAPNSKGKGMIVYLVKENNEALASMQKGDSLIISLKKTANKGETKAFQVSYKGVPSDGLIISKNRYGDRTFFADNWPNRAHNWIPCKDEPGDKATFEFIVTAPSHYSVIANGKLQEAKMLAGNMKLTHWVEDVSLSTKVMVIGVAKFAVKQFADSPPGIPISAWTYPQDSTIGFRNYSVAPSIVKYFSDYIGAYPYNKLANVESTTVFGGMENASAIFYYEKSAEEGRSPEDIIAHEIAHQWFGDMVSEKKFSHLWLSEGFATYFENLYLGSRYGEDSMKNKLTEDRQQVIDFAKRSNRPVVDSISQLMSLLNPNSYQKGGWVLYMLRNEMGDSVFQKFIRTFYDRFKGKNADTNDLEKIAEEVSNKDWNPFFKEWLYTPGIPILDIQWKNNEKGDTVSLTVTQVQSQFVFQFPLQIKLESAQGSDIKTLNISKQSETFLIPMGTTTSAIVADPNTQLLFDSRIEKITP